MLTPVTPANPAATANLDLTDLVQFDVASASPLAWVAVACLAAYLTGAISLWWARSRWSIPATISFTLGTLVWFASTGLSLNAYAGDLVSVLLFQQITLLVVVPPLLLMGSPGRLLLRATPHRGLGAPLLRAGLASYRSRAAHALLHPGVAIIVAAVAFPGLYFSDAISWVLAVPGGHLILLTLLLAFGVIAAAPLWALDPMPRKPSYVVRLIDVLIEIQIHALFGLMLLRAGGAMFSWYADEPTAWGITRELDQAIGGSLAWSYGELPLLIVLIVTLSKWRKSDIRSAPRRRPQEDADLDEYNKYLAAMAERTAQSSEKAGSR